MKRRGFIGGAAAASALAFLPRSIAESGRIGAIDIEDAWQALRRLYELDDVVGGADGFPIALDMVNKLRAALNKGTFAGRAEAELQTLTAAAMEHIAWIAFDSGDANSSRRWWLEANHLGEIAGATDTRVMALTAMSLQTSSSPNRAKETVGLVEAARKIAGDSASATLLSLLSAREAVAHAQQKDAAGARLSLSVSRRWLDQGRNGSEPVVLNFWGEADLACHETRIALLNGDERTAERCARSALNLADEDAFPRNYTLYAVRLGEVLTRNGQLDEAISVTSNAVDRVSAVKGSHRINHSLDRTVGLLDMQDYEPAREFSYSARKALGK